MYSFHAVLSFILTSMFNVNDNRFVVHPLLPNLLKNNLTDQRSENQSPFSFLSTCSSVLDSSTL